MVMHDMQLVAPVRASDEPGGRFRIHGKEEGRLVGEMEKGERDFMDAET